MYFAVAGLQIKRISSTNLYLCSDEEIDGDYVDILTSKSIGIKEGIFLLVVT